MGGLPLLLLYLHATLSLYTWTATAATPRILIYSATRDFRHDSIPTAIQALKANQASIGAEFDATEDETQFTDSILANYDTILFLSTTGEGELPSKCALLRDADFEKSLTVPGRTRSKSIWTLEALSWAYTLRRIPCGTRHFISES